jgi:hypothetical protein
VLYMMQVASQNGMHYFLVEHVLIHHTFFGFSSDLSNPTYARLRNSRMLYCEVSFTHFRRIWREDPDLSKIHCRKWMRFMKCDLCTKLRSSLTTSVLDGVRYHTERIRRLYLQHIRQVKAERGCYWARRRFACEFPGVKLSITIDGSDQINNGCPWYFTKTHAMEGRLNYNMFYQKCVLFVEARKSPLICLFFIGCYKFRLHVYGVLVHGRAPFVYLVQDHVEQGHLWSSIIHIFNFGSLFNALGSNITIECLQQTLVRLQRMRIPIPSHLDLQLDNTTKQNKNK